MQNNILCGYCKIKIDFGHWKTCFLGEKLFFKTQNLTLWARKFQIFTEACYTYTDGFLGVTRAHEKFLTLWSETVQTVVGEQMSFLWVRVARKNAM